MTDADSQASKPIDAAREALTVRRVFGEPYEADGVTVIPVARVLGGAGMGYGSGAGRDPRSSESGPIGEGSGGGGGFGVRAVPAGVFVVRGGDVTWKPALNLNRAILGGQLLAGVIAVAAACTARTRAKLRARELVLSRVRRG
ncbi:spore germination protein GerW family protein [Ruania albidiflava]|uniref:spore germination protein GerW family protein n=1 Tax=Ruania albidiflava TaxID=366586 RepID=UPI0003B44169|nr:spore germination protein GerW family protein [Ruania albidiflava]